MDSLHRMEVLDTMIETANALSRNRSLFSDSLGGKVYPPKGVLLCGDLTDNGTEKQWHFFEDHFGIDGDKKLKIPVFETFGNHDGTVNDPVRSGVKIRNASRKSIWHSPDNLFYSWDWGQIHFVSLGLYPGNGWDSTCQWCHYFKTSFREPENSLDFLKQDLTSHGKGKYIVLYFHYGWDEFSCLWWTKKEQDALYRALDSYNIAAIFTGHNHAVGYSSWRGYDVYSAGSAQQNDHTGSFLMIQFKKDSLYVLERNNNGWGPHIYRKKYK